MVATRGGRVMLCSNEVCRCNIVDDLETVVECGGVTTMGGVILLESDSFDCVRE